MAEQKELLSTYEACKEHLASLKFNLSFESKQLLETAFMSGVKQGKKEIIAKIKEAKAKKKKQ